MLEIWQAVVLGLVEGITEYLPVSSTGHLILAESLMGLDTPERREAVNAFTIVVQGGAILAVVGLYWPHVLRMLKGLMGKDRDGLRLLVNLGFAFAPAAVLGLLFEKKLEEKLFHAGPVLAAILVGGIYMMVLDMWGKGRLSMPRPAVHEKTIYEVTPGQAFLIGLLQCVAMWPGTSRSMMTITGGMMVGLRPRQAAEFSFLLGLPTLTAATLYKLAKNLWNAHETQTPNLFEALGVLPVVVGLVVAAVSAAVAVKWLVAFLTRHGLMVFGWYRVALFVVLAALISSGAVRIGDHPKSLDSQTTTVPPVKWDR